MILLCDDIDVTEHDNGYDHLSGNLADRKLVRPQWGTLTLTVTECLNY
jgi:hypothetical protein